MNISLAGGLSLVKTQKKCKIKVVYFYATILINKLFTRQVTPTVEWTNEDAIYLCMEVFASLWIHCKQRSVAQVQKINIISTSVEYRTEKKMIKNSLVSYHILSSENISFFCEYLNSSLYKTALEGGRKKDSLFRVVWRRRN